MHIYNFPNPFEDSTSLYYNLPTSGNVKITLLDTSGKILNVLVNTFQASGKHVKKLDIPDHQGLILCKIQLGDSSKTIKMISR